MPAHGRLNRGRPMIIRKLTICLAVASTLAATTALAQSRSNERPEARPPQLSIDPFKMQEEIIQLKQQVAQLEKSNGDLQQQLSQEHQRLMGTVTDLGAFEAKFAKHRHQLDDKSAQQLFVHTLDCKAGGGSGGGGFHCEDKGAIGQVLASTDGIIGAVITSPPNQ